MFFKIFYLKTEMKRVMSGLRHRFINQISLWGIGVSIILVVILLTSDMYNRIMYVKYVSPEIDLFWKLDNKEIGSITINQKVIFKLDSNSVLKRTGEDLIVGRQEIIVYDGLGEIIAKDTVSIDLYDLYELTIFEINKGQEEIINISMTEVLLD